MLKATQELIRAALKTDESISARERERLIALIKQPPTDNQPTIARAEPRLIRRAQAATRLACCTRTIDQLASKGILPRRRLPGRKRAAGFLEQDVQSLILGRDVAAPSSPQPIPL